MREICELLKERQKKLILLKKKKEKELLKAPEGTLHIRHGRKGIQYYHRISTKDINGTYIKKENQHLANKLAQKDYNKKILRAASQELKVIQQYLAHYPDIDIEEVYETLHENRQCLITPIEETDDEFVNNWLETPYAGKEFYENISELYTLRGERVRSKSELIIANLLYQEGIPYRYEQPVYLDGLGTVHPDFTVLNVRLRKEYYWEHLGLMDDPEYAENALNKINIYEQNEIFPGEKLLITHETRMRPLNPKQVMLLIGHYLK